jgi:hypothetical protein
MLTGIDRGMIVSSRMQKKTPPLGMFASAKKAPNGGININAGINNNK